MAIVRPVIRHHFRSMRPTLRQIRPAQKALLDALVATPFDAEALDQSLEELRLLLGTTQTESHASLVEVASKLTDAERQQLAEFMRRPYQRPPPDSGAPDTSFKQRLHKQQPQRVD